jgi:hypothetical protein
VRPEQQGVNAWYIEGVPFTTYEVKLDMTQTEKTMMVTWEQVQGGLALT